MKEVDDFCWNEKPKWESKRNKEGNCSALKYDNNYLH
jgi:hypothetical protein